MASGAIRSDTMQMAACKSESARNGVNLPPLRARREMRAKGQNESEEFHREARNNKGGLGAHGSQHHQRGQN